MQMMRLLSVNGVGTVWRQVSLVSEHFAGPDLYLVYMLSGAWMQCISITQQPGDC